ncbi:MAG: methionyl-tRNA formyltransferase [Phycisphaerae bacterium]|jgi:methionyl-tRNA formyltransferase|nr:MAG: methionyl-tRNA formyltransferase [Phycisphaerae bacterium]
MTVQGMKLIFAGSGEFGIPTLRRLLESGATIQRVYTQPDRPAGRGKKLCPTPLAGYALQQGLEVVRTADINAEHLPPADAMVVIAFGQKIAPHVVHHPRFGSINLHASILPRYRGAAPIHWARMNGETVTGNSVIRLAQKMDAGPILAQSQVAIGETETTGELHDRLAENGAPLIEQVLVQLRLGTAVETEQDHTQATLAPKLTREHTLIKWNDTARKICHQILGLYPWPGCRVRVIDDHEQEIDQVTLIRARVVESVRDGFVGILDANGRIGAADHMIEILELQPRGKRPMTLEAYKNGHPWKEGMRLESIH